MSIKGLVLEGFKHWIFLISVKELLKLKLKPFCGSLKSLPTQLFYGTVILQTPFCATPWCKRQDVFPWQGTANKPDRRLKKSSPRYWQACCHCDKCCEICAQGVNDSLTLDVLLLTVCALWDFQVSGGVRCALVVVYHKSRLLGLSFG